MEFVLLYINLGVSWGMMVLIWLIQRVHYPAFRYVSEKKFIPFHRMHTRRITWIVFPLMSVELFLAFYFIFQFPADWLWLVNGLLVGLLWLTTIFIQIPMHKKLSAGKDNEAIRRLINSNWWRTLFWTTKAILAIWVLL